MIDRVEQTRIREMVKRLANDEAVESHRESALKECARYFNKHDLKRVSCYPTHTEVTKSTVGVWCDGAMVDPEDDVPVGGYL